jgi:hypothetical protein
MQGGVLGGGSDRDACHPGAEYPFPAPPVLIEAEEEVNARVLGGEEVVPRVVAAAKVENASVAATDVGVAVDGTCRTDGGAQLTAIPIIFTFDLAAGAVCIGIAVRRHQVQRHVIAEALIIFTRMVGMLASTIIVAAPVASIRSELTPIMVMSAASTFVLRGAIFISSRVTYVANQLVLVVRVAMVMIKNATVDFIAIRIMGTAVTRVRTAKIVGVVITTTTSILALALELHVGLIFAFLLHTRRIIWIINIMIIAARTTVLFMATCATVRAHRV